MRRVLKVGKKGGISFMWNFTYPQIFKRKGFGKELNKDIAEILKRHMDKYVPWDSKNLSNYHLATMVHTTSTKDHGTVVYSMNYAKKQYTGDSYNHDTAVHELATSRWDRVCWMFEKQEILAEIDLARKARAK